MGNACGSSGAESRRLMTTYPVLGTPLLATTYEELTPLCQQWARDRARLAIDFSNTHIVTLRRGDPHFRALTSRFDYFIPDGMPLRSEEHTSELQSRLHLVCRLL